MAKETFYFSHDYNSRSDRRMMNLLMLAGIEGIGIYWCIVEMLYEEGGYLMLNECERIAFELRTNCDKINLVINSSLFVNDKEKFWSESVLSRLNTRKEKSESAAKSAYARWGNKKEMRTHSDRISENNKRNAIKESKVKESKVNKFITMPLPEHFNGLPEIKVGASIELIRITANKKVTEKDVKDIWEVFKVQNLTGNKFYQDADAVYSHFINWVKTQKFKDDQILKPKKLSI